MTAVTRSGAAAGPLPTGGLEVCTSGSDTLRASIRVEGELTCRTVPLLLSVLGTHLRAGRRYLRVDLAASTIEEPAVVRSLADAHASLAVLGGMLVFDHADALVADTLRGSELNVAPRA